MILNIGLIKNEEILLAELENFQDKFASESRKYAETLLT